MVAVARTWSTLSACFGTVFGLAEECMPSDFSAFLQFFTTKIHHSTTSQQLFHPAWKGSSKARLSKTAQFSWRLPGIEKRLACRVIGVPHLHHCSKTPNASSMEIHCFLWMSLLAASVALEIVRRSSLFMSKANARTVLRLICTVVPRVAGDTTKTQDIYVTSLL